ncbi:hypothetical protein EMIHUDRAFT_437691, partial [Emiliania huxleyi CCMP1516]|uniref:Uncharacterized protein n=2 Tax=Emiliania huxleyi TaxID=2903 RepID=A0A0D3IIP0_EMIH1
RAFPRLGALDCRRAAEEWTNELLNRHGSDGALAAARAGPLPPPPLRDLRLRDRAGGPFPRRGRRRPPRRPPPPPPPRPPLRRLRDAVVRRGRGKLGPFTAGGVKRRCSQVRRGGTSARVAARVQRLTRAPQRRGAARDAAVGELSFRRCTLG